MLVHKLFLMKKQRAKVLHLQKSQALLTRWPHRGKQLYGGGNVQKRKPRLSGGSEGGVGAVDGADYDAGSEDNTAAVPVSDRPGLSGHGALLDREG